MYPINKFSRIQNLLLLSYTVLLFLLFFSGTKLRAANGLEAGDSEIVLLVKQQRESGVLLEWIAEPFAVYDILYSSDLVNWHNAVSGQVQAPAEGGKMQWLDTSIGSNSSRIILNGNLFYKVILIDEVRDFKERPSIFTSNEGERMAVFRGSFSVPENRTKSGSRDITVSYLRFPSTSETPGPPIVYLAGGPGGIGEEGAGNLFQYVKRLLEFGDVIGFNQRGTGPSNDIPVYYDDYIFPLDQAVQWSDVSNVYAEAARKAAAFWSSEGIDITGYNTLESARDVEDLRRALGVDRITLWGGSFGSQLAMATAREMRGRVDRVILEGIEGVNQTAKFPLRRDSYFDRLQVAIDTQPNAVEAFPDLIGLMRRVHAKYEAEPLDISVERSSGERVDLVVGKVELQILAGSLVENPVSTPNLLALYRAADAGDFSNIGPLIYESIRKKEFHF